MNNQNLSQDLNHQYYPSYREEFLKEYTPKENTLSYYVFNNNLELLEKKLLEPNTDCNVSETFGKTSSWTPLYWAVKLNRKEAVCLLLEHGADLNIIVHDFDECCGTALDLATLRNDIEMESLLRAFADKSEISLGQAFKAIRTKLRGKAPSFNFKNYSKKETSILQEA